METDVVASQQELFPQHISLNINDASILKELKPELEKMGFRLEAMNNTTFVINGIPVDCKGSDAVSVIERILEDYKTNLTGNQSDKKLNLARSMASQMAVKSGQTLTDVEMQDIIDRLFGCAVAEVSPNGKKIYTIISAEDIKTRLS
jgi:DNA mismatch repair protein MutL